MSKPKIIRACNKFQLTSEDIAVPGNIATVTITCQEAKECKAILKWEALNKRGN